jgi:hypothetical protein
MQHDPARSTADDLVVAKNFSLQVGRWCVLSQNTSAQSKDTTKWPNFTG